MATNRYFWLCMQSCMQLLLTFMLSACNSSGAPETDAVPGAKLSYKLELQGTGGEGSAGSPYIVPAGGRLEAAISQQSSYNESGNRSFGCTPAATLEIAADQAELAVESKQELSAVIGEPETKTSMSLDEPAQMSVSQKFVIGAQTVRCTLKYDIYHYITKENAEIEMPYVRLYPLVLKKVSAVSAENGAYAISALFELKLETAAVAPVETQTLHIVLKYAGTIEN